MSHKIQRSLQLQPKIDELRRPVDGELSGASCLLALKENLGLRYRLDTNTDIQSNFAQCVKLHDYKAFIRRFYRDIRGVGYRSFPLRSGGVS